MIVSTKCYQKEYLPVLQRAKEGAYNHGDERWLITNNMADDITDEAKKYFDRVIRAEDYIEQAEKEFGVQGEMTRAYSMSELVAIYLADEPLCHYSADVIPPEGSWVKEAEKLLGQFTVVTTSWEGQGSGTGYDVDCSFSDQCYVINPHDFKKDIYNFEHPVGLQYPQHGANSFEKRVGMWMNATNKRRAVLQGYVYRHIDRRDKQWIT